ncbi:hypothetical protein NQ314_015709 [Rhamnusium bicolor]|uniref:Uncharacterized protein n=1 Tax=Rhamnusium bicolor TaxID=1586634 RepID=A0AAV8WY26_9CUCU|nr:hypothetical protein NQ314_015709 [Rhamnusium bicolor]
MLYENEELRLKTININAEVESRQSDIKKLKRENEMLKKGLWYLRDEYDKLEKLIKDKKIDFSSSSTTCSSSTSDTESCTSCSEESEEVETTQNIKNVQRTNLKNIQDQFDHLSVVTEETSADNSEQNSNRASLPNENWNNFEKDVIKPDQSYPDYKNITKSQTLPVQEKLGNSMGNVAGDSIANNFGDSFVDQTGNSSGNFQHLDPNCEHFLSHKIVQTNANSFYQNMVLVPKSNMPQPEAKAMEKSSTDLIVKIDNQNFNNNALVFSNTPSQSTFSNGGNLEELLNDIESISQEILKMSNLQRGVNNQNIQDRSGMFQQEESQFMSEIRREDLTFMQNPVMDHLMSENSQTLPNTPERPYKKSLNSKTLEELSASQQNLCVIPPPAVDPNTNLPPPIFLEENGLIRACDETETNPFFFGNLKDNYVNSDYFNMRYNPDNFTLREEEQKKGKCDPKSGSKTNLLDLTSSEHVSSENEENLKFKTSKPEKIDEKNHQKSEQLPQDRKTKKVNVDSSPEVAKPKTPGEKKHSLFDIRLNDGDKNKNKEKIKISHQKTPSVDSKKSTTETSNQEPRTPTSSDSKVSNDKKNFSTNERKDISSEKKMRKSVSVSPDRNKHVQLREEGKKHKKHKKGERNRMRRPSIIIDPRNFRERSFSVCTDRSNIMEHRLGLGLGFGSSFLYDEYSDRERTNSLSSCDTAENGRKLSTMSNVPLSGKVPWCGCWGNGCL